MQAVAVLSLRKKRKKEKKQLNKAHLPKQEKKHILPLDSLLPQEKTNLRTEALLLAAMGESCLWRDYQTLFGPAIRQCCLLMAAERMALPLAFCSGGDCRATAEQGWQVLCSLQNQGLC